LVYLYHYTSTAMITEYLDWPSKLPVIVFGM